MSETLEELALEYRVKVLTAPSKLRQAIDEQAPRGEADILVAVFDIPDTDVSVGNVARQVIDRGAFEPYLTSDPFPAPLFLDHGGNAHPLRPPHRAELRIGKVVAGNERSEGLAVTAVYNLAKQAAREAYSELDFAPELVGWSFASLADREKIVSRAGDPLDHIAEMWPAEYSHVGFGAQKEARLLALRNRVAIASHSSPTSDAPWNGPKNEAAYPNEAAALRTVHAWREPEGDADAKSTYKFPHHFASGGAASTRACSAGIAVLNGGRGGSNIPDADRAGVHRHLAKHITDADMDAPPLRTAAWTPDEVGVYLNSPEFMEALAGVLVTDPARAKDVKAAAEAALADRPTDARLEMYREFFESYK